jgi:23S rRNA (uracil1939-C5)-methyltransferase
MAASTSTGDLKSGDRVEVTVDKLVYRGLGLARHEGRVLFIRGAYPGERWRVRVSKVRRDFAEAEAQELLVAGGLRRPSSCPHFPACGGCTHLDLDYKEQLRWKAAILAECLDRAQVAWSHEVPVAPSPEDGWRLRAGLHIAQRDAALILGFESEGSHRLVATQECRQLSPQLYACAQALTQALDRHPGLRQRVRRVDLTESADAQQRVALLGGRFTAQDLGPLRATLQPVAGLGGVTLQLERAVPVSGAQSVVMGLNDLQLRVSAASFFQPNRFLVEGLVAEVLRQLPSGTAVIDLFAGVGLFALHAARRARRVRAVEINPSAVRDARANAAAAALSNVTIFQGDAAEVLRRWPAEEDEWAILDPPRAGLDGRLAEALAERRPKGIVYVSCEPPTLARDLRLLTRRGYRIDSVRAFDMFPNTFHLETVVRLSV